MRVPVLLLVIIIFLSGCAGTNSAFSVTKKYPPDKLQKDYTLYRDILEEMHPGLYWYTPQDSMNYYFDWGKKQLDDSLTESQFRKILNYVTAKIDCGHTTVKPSRRYTRFLDTLRNRRLFPLSLQVWEDTAVVVANLNRKDSILRPGTVIRSINQKPIRELTDTFFQYISSDGYNRTHKFRQVSTGNSFGRYYSYIFGNTDQYDIGFVDSLGLPAVTRIRNYDPGHDSTRRRARRPTAFTKRQLKRIALLNTRNLQTDSTGTVAFMTLNTFSRGSHLKKFFRQSFRYLHRHGIDQLVIDLRNNGGGNVGNSTLLTKFIADKEFKIADSLYAKQKKSRYGRYIQNYFFNQVFIAFMTRKGRDGKFHFGYFERKYFKPRKNNHFGGNVYVMIGGNSFSATTLFTYAVMQQENVTVVGEETGGGLYGNSAWSIPDVTLPETHVKFRLPLFRLVIDHSLPKTGHGILPEIIVNPDIESVVKRKDYTLEKVMELIRQDRARETVK